MQAQHQRVADSRTLIVEHCSHATRKCNSLADGTKGRESEVTVARQEEKGTKTITEDVPEKTSKKKEECQKIETKNM